MPEYDDPIGRALAGAVDEAAGYVRPPGPTSVITTVRRRRRRRTFAAGVVVLAAAVVPVFVVTSGRHANPPTEIWGEFVACARTHGNPDFPDPVVNPDGSATFPAGLPQYEFEAVRVPCGRILDRLPPGARSPSTR